MTTGPSPPSGIRDELPRPDYAGGSIVNLMSSVITGRGGRAAYPPLRLLPPREVERYTSVLLLVVDGLGAEWLTRQSPLGVLSRHLRGTMTSVFPPTTASAITTYLTGEGPQQHALTGWFTYFRELGCVVTVLPGRPRYGGATYTQAGVDLRKLFGHVPVSERIRTRAVTVSPVHIARSDFNLAHLGRSRLMTFETLEEMFRQAALALRADSERKYLYLYWPKLDTIGHEAGINSPAARRHLKEIEQHLTDFLALAAGTDTLTLVTADHGQIETAPRDCIEVADHPDLEDCLALPLCGEPRAAFCYLRPGRSGDFERYCREVLGNRLRVYPSRTLCDEGLFGLGVPHPRLRHRIGDYTLLMRDAFVIRDRLPTEKPFRQVGVHGGLTRTELQVPLCVLGASVAGGRGSPARRA
jgi:hypothetical protein